MFVTVFTAYAKYTDIESGDICMTDIESQVISIISHVRDFPRGKGGSVYTEVAFRIQYNSNYSCSMCRNGRHNIGVEGLSFVSPWLFNKAT